VNLVINWPGRAAEKLDWPTNFTHGEMRLIKRVTGLRPSEISEAIDASDADVIVAYAAVALRRAHPGFSDRDISAELDALQFGSIDLVDDDHAHDDGGQSPPAESADAERSAESSSAPAEAPEAPEAPEEPEHN
jgi:hypothetical protein